MYDNMKKILNLWLMAALTVGLSMSVTSCKDDDDNNAGGEPETEEQAATVSKFWSVVGQLVSTDDYTADYADKTFEPVYGIADASNETTRIVETNDMQTAARYFADLITVDDGSPVAIDENTQSYTYSDPDVGTLTYTRGGTAEDWATVDVNIKQVPRLRKIVYRQGGEGTNTGFAGKAYYRFGDVVSRTVDDETEYWICVRPAFGPESTSSSFWVCMNSLPQKNYEYVNGSNGHSYFVPTGIGTDKKDMQNLAEMLYAICYPQQWYENATNLHTDGKYWGYSGMPIFNDWTKANLMYHNQYFWQKVADAWKSKDIPGKAMNVDFAMLDKMTKPEGNGVNLLYKGYSWWTKTSWSCTLYQASFTHGTKNAEKNLHHAEYKDLKRNMKDINGFSCLKMGAKTDNYAQFFDNDGKIRWVVRFATGEELNGGTKPAPTAQLQGGCQDVYRYYTEYPDEWHKKGPKGDNDNGPEVTEEQKQLEIPARVGALVGLDGKFYENKANCEAAGTQPVAMVVYLSTDGHRVEKGQPWTGLALALSDEASADGSGQFQWTVGDARTTMDLCTTCVSGGKRTDEGNSGDLETDYCSFVLDGWAMTKRMVQRDCFNHSHPAAEAAWSTANRPAGFSEWFMPSIGQWILALKGMGYEREYTRRYLFSSNNYLWSFKNNGKWLWEEAGVTEAALKSDYATSTQHHGFANEIYNFDGARSFTNSEKDYTKFRVRRMIAFGDGATIDPQTFPQPIDPRPGAILSDYGYCFANMDDLKFYFKESNAKGMVVYYSKTKRVEEGENYNGLAIGLKDYEASEWCTYKDAAGHECSVAVGGAADYAKAMAGGAISELLAQNKDGHEHPAARRSRENSSNEISRGFLPSAGQWILAKQGLGYTWSTDGVGHFNTAGKWPWPEAGLAQYATADVAEYWTCTEQKDGNTYKVLAVSPNGVSFKLHDKTDKLLVRPFFAFGHWGTED